MHHLHHRGHKVKERYFVTDFLDKKPNIEVSGWLNQTKIYEYHLQRILLKKKINQSLSPYYMTLIQAIFL